MKTLLGLILCFSVTAASAGEIEDACRDLVMDYAVHRDSFNVDAYANLFTEDAVLILFRKEYRGREAIRERLSAIAGKESIRHLVSTVRITVVDDSHATGLSYATVYTAAPGDMPRKSESPVVGEYRDEYLLTPEGWKISRRTFKPIFID